MERDYPGKPRRSKDTPSGLSRHLLRTVANTSTHPASAPLPATETLQGLGPGILGTSQEHPVAVLHIAQSLSKELMDQNKFSSRCFLMFS